MSKIIAIITARGGSKRIPLKNIREFFGKPMLAYAIEAAVNSKIFDEIMVSTDSDKIKDIALEYGAKVPFKRSEATANDFASTEQVLKEVIFEYKKRGMIFDFICCIYPCSPLLTSNILIEAYSRFINSLADALIPVVKFSHPVQRALKLNEHNFLEYREPLYKNTRTQDLEPMYHDAGMFYFYKTLNPKKLLMYEMKECNVQDIDNEEDWLNAEIKYKILHNMC